MKLFREYKVGAGGPGLSLVMAVAGALSMRTVRYSRQTSSGRDAVELSHRKAC